MTTVDVSAEVAEPPDWLPDTRRTATRVLAELGITRAEVSVVLCDDRRMAELNRTYRGRDEPTDVLTFSQGDGDAVPGTESGTVAGDVVISVESVHANASQYGLQPAEEFVRVLTHGILHLAGYTHEGVSLGDAEAAHHPMLGLQEKIVTTIAKEQKQ